MDGGEIDFRDRKPLRRRRSPFSIRPMRIALQATALYVGLILFVSALAVAVFLNITSTPLSAYSKQIVVTAILLGLSAAFLAAVLVFVLRRVRRIESIAMRQRDALRHSEKRASVGLVAASIAHEMSTIIAALDSAMQVPTERGARADPALQQLYQILSAGFTQLQWLTERLNRSSPYSYEPNFSRVDVTQLCRDLVVEVRQDSSADQCSLSVSDSLPVSTVVIAPLLTQLLRQLILYAVDNTDGEGIIELRTCKEDEFVCIEIHDDGDSLSNIDRERFQLNDLPREPSPFHLSVFTARLIAQAHGGEFCVAPSDLGGNCFRLKLHSIFEGAVSSADSEANETESSEMVVSGVDTYIVSQKEFAWQKSVNR